MHWSTKEKCDKILRAKISAALGHSGLRASQDTINFLQTYAQDPINLVNYITAKTQENKKKYSAALYARDILLWGWEGYMFGWQLRQTLRQRVYARDIPLGVRVGYMFRCKFSCSINYGTAVTSVRGSAPSRSLRQEIEVYGREDTEDLFRAQGYDESIDLASVTTVCPKNKHESCGSTVMFHRRSRWNWNKLGHSQGEATWSI